MRAAFAAVLLLLQGVAGAAVTLAHAAEPLSAASHIEGQHELGCPALHDVQTCALCHYAGAKVTSPPVVRIMSAQVERTRTLVLQPVPVPTSVVHLTPPARAPPLFLS